MKLLIPTIRLRGKRESEMKEGRGEEEGWMGERRKGRGEGMGLSYLHILLKHKLHDNYRPNV